MKALTELQIYKIYCHENGIPPKESYKSHIMDTLRFQRFILHIRCIELRSKLLKCVFGPFFKILKKVFDNPR